jgi:hypothetical protein
MQDFHFRAGRASTTAAFKVGPNPLNDRSWGALLTTELIELTEVRDLWRAWAASPKRKQC